MDRSEHDFLLSVWQRKLPGGCDWEWRRQDS
jgi:hypothetical protein